MKYVHRENHDGTYDSICPECYHTVATVQWEADLEAAEQAHVCDRWELKRLEEVKAGPHPVESERRGPARPKAS